MPTIPSRHVGTACTAHTPLPTLRFCARDTTLIVSPRQRVGAELEFQHLAGLPLAAFDMIRRAAGVGRPDPAALPATIGIVNAPIEPLGMEAHRIGHAQRDE